MPYEPTNWKTGDVVTSAKLNKLEQGVSGGGVLKVTENPETHALDKTWQEIYDAGFAVLYYASGTPGDTYILYSQRIMYAEGHYGVQFYNPEIGDMLFFESDAADGVLTAFSN